MNDVSLSFKEQITMTTQTENKDKAEQKVSKDELSDQDLANVTGGDKSAIDRPAETLSLNFTKVEYKNT
jgi:bacteriocin-like protein